MPPIPVNHITIFYILLLLSTLLASTTYGDNDHKKLYIVHLEDHPSRDESSVIQSHVDLLSSLKQSSDFDAREAVVHSYHRSLNAFAARLSEDEAKVLSGMDEVLTVYENKYHKLHTTKSWDFIGLPQNATRSLETETDVIVALFDTGITPESESFNDEGLGPPPSKWKGSCGKYTNFSGCNNKIIGAKIFKLDGELDPLDILSPTDTNGHGTHTSSTVAGNLIPNASLSGLAAGTSRGAVPGARIAVYKVCWASSGCSDADILAAFDHAVSDGVDVISISIGGPSPSYVTGSISIGSFHAMRNGILTVGSAGNDGPFGGSVVNHAPWMVSVAASGIDRGFTSRVYLGNGMKLEGVGIDLFDTKGKSYSLVSGVGAAKSSEDKENARYCVEDSMNPSKVKGKLVLCKLQSWGVDSVVKEIGGIGAIVSSPSFLDTPMVFMAPGTLVNYTVGDKIDQYIHSSSSPSAVIHRTQEVTVSAPFIASFSSRGPNPGSLRLLKPDISAPGIDILASYTPLRSLTGLKGDSQYSKFNIMSGTSMACPHVAGVAAYVKSFHPSWSPAAIRSAIMTTATAMSSRVNPEAEFAYGSGQVNPHRAMNPGLVYDMDEMPYIQFLCQEGYTSASLSVLVRSKSINCSSLIPSLGYDSLNYPTMQLAYKKKQGPTVAVFRRRVTNVGPSQSVYNATVKAPKGVNITVKPTSLAFSHKKHIRSFKIVVKADPLVLSARTWSASLIWKSDRHVVRSSIVIHYVSDEIYEKTM